jgi:recombination protein RecA
MLQRTKKETKNLSEQVKEHANKKHIKTSDESDGNFEHVISTGSTLLDLAISGGIVRGGGLPGGILVEIFGPPSSGKTLLLCEIGGAIQRQGGELKIFDPEARLDKQYARMFDLHVTDENYETPDTVPEVFTPIRKWDVDTNKINGVLADSLAALSTKMELSEDGDKYGMRRAKEFSEELRKTCRVIKKKNILIICSNQVRDNVGASQYEPKFRTTGGQGIPYYASLRLRCYGPQKIKKEKALKNGKVVSRVIGVETQIEVVKSSIWKPFHTCVIPILFNYGVDSIRQNLQFLKEYTKSTSYIVDGQKLSNSLDHACHSVETNNLQKVLRDEVIDLWTSIETSFEQERQPKYE